MVTKLERLTEALKDAAKVAPDMMWINFTGNLDDAGFIPSFMSVHDPRPAVEQIDDNYRAGGGWNSYTRGFRPDFDNLILHSTLGDPPIKCRGITMLRDEVIMLFEHDWLVILQPDGSWDCARLD